MARSSLKGNTNRNCHKLFHTQQRGRTDENK
jgi:hypothetical protein